MKAFANITLGELSRVQDILYNEMNAILAEDVEVIMVNWDAYDEYLHDMWEDEYDEEDRYIVDGNLFISEDGNFLYVLEVQEDKYGVEHLHIKTIVNC